MGLDLTITYKDPRLPPLSVFFCNQRVLRDVWRPLAKKLKLPLLQRLECLFLRTKSEAEQLLLELRVVEERLDDPKSCGIDDATADYLLEGLDKCLPLLDETVAHWQEVRELSL